MKSGDLIPAVPFVKAEADGNDFLLLPASAVAPAARAAVTRAICDRRRGLGADGVEWWRYSPRRRELRLDLVNSDGSPAEFSGNGTRCAVAWCAERFGTGEITVITAAGRKHARRLPGPPEGYPPADGAAWLEITMGPPIFAPESIPAAPAAGQFAANRRPPEPLAASVAARQSPASASNASVQTRAAEPLPLRDWLLEVPSGPTARRWPVTALSMGNPQCCVLVAAFPPDWAEVAAALSHHAAFPRQANVEFVRILGPQEIEIRICERGAGVTLSSGTGSCASAVAAILAGKVQSPVRVRTPGGVQQVSWAGAETPVFLQGPARIVALGRWRPSPEAPRPKP